MLNDKRNTRIRRKLARVRAEPLRSRAILPAALCSAAGFLLSAPMNDAAAQAQSGAGRDVLLSLHSLTPSTEGEIVYSLSSGGTSLHMLPVAISSGRGVRTVRVTHQGTLEITQADAPDLNLEDISCQGAMASVDLAARKVILALASEGPVSCTFANGASTQTATLTGQTLQRTAKTITSGLASSSDRITGRLSESMVRRIPVPKVNGDAGEENRTSAMIPLTGDATGQTGNAKFRTTLSDIADAKAREQGEKIRASGLEMPGITVARSRLDGWVEGNVGYVRDKNNNTSDDFSNLAIGADYRISERWLLGMAGAYHNIDSRTVEAAPDISGKGWMAGPYAGYKINDQMFLSLKALHGVGETRYFAAPENALDADGLETRRWLLDATVSGNLKSGNWTLTPSAQVTHFGERGSQVVDGAATVDAKADSGRFLFGPQISYEFKPNNGTSITPRAAVKGLWEIEDIRIDDPAMENLKNENLSARVEAGIAVTSSRAKLDFSGSVEGLGNEDGKAASGKATLSVPLN